MFYTIHSKSWYIAIFLFAICIVGTIVQVLPISGQSNKEAPSKGYIIKLKEGLKDKEKYLSKHGLKQRSAEILDNAILVSTEKSAFDPEFVEIIEDNSPLQIQSLNVSDPLALEQWYLEAVSYNDMQTSKKSSKQKLIAVIDSGICISHPDLADRIVEGWNFVDNNSDVSDQNGHGCAVSGIIAANTNNKLGIAGASSDSLIMPLKVIGSDGSGEYVNLINAIDYAIKKKVDIINISLGGYNDSKILRESIKNAVKKGITIVASSGNTSNGEIMYPAKLDEVISVGSVENDYTVSNFSSKSEEIDLWAYGNDILTLNKENKYSKFTGTSISTALVSAFLSEKGIFEDGSIVNFKKPDIKPIFQNKLVKISEPESGLSFEVPENLQVYGFENENPQSYVINWQRIVKVASGESMIVSIWSRDGENEIKNVLEEIKEMDGCNKTESLNLCLNARNNFNSYIYYLQINNSLVRIIYSASNYIGYNIFLSILSSIKINSNQILEKTPFLDIHTDSTNKIYAQVDSCGGLTDIGNPFPCCSSSWQPSGDYNDANCTWYSMYKRPDLRGKVWGDAGSWISNAQQSGLTTASNPSPGAIVVWSGHVAYIESVSGSNMTWSEQNCYKYWVDANNNKNYGVNAFNSSVTRPTNSTYGGTLLGFIPITSENNCNGTNPTMQNWNSNGPLSCSPTGSLTIQPDSTLNPTSGTITIIPN